MGIKSFFDEILMPLLRKNTKLYQILVIGLLAGLLPLIFPSPVRKSYNVYLFKIKVVIQQPSNKTLNCKYRNHVVRLFFWSCASSGCWNAYHWRSPVFCPSYSFHSLALCHPKTQPKYTSWLLFFNFCISFTPFYKTTHY